MKKQKKFNLFYSIFLSLIAIIGAIFLIGLVLALSFNNRFYPRTKISNIDLGGKTKQEAIVMLKQQNQTYLEKGEITINFEDKNIILKPNQIQTEFEVEKTVDFVFDKTHGKLIISIGQSLNSIFLSNNWTQQLTINKDLLNQEITKLTQNKISEPKDAKLEIINNSIIFTEAVAGEKPNVESAQKECRQKISLLDNARIELNKIKVLPEINDIDLAQAYFKTSWLLQNKGFDLIKDEDVIYSVNSKDLKNWLKFEKKYYSLEGDGNFKGKVAGVSVSMQDETGVFLLPQIIKRQEILEASIDEKKIGEFINYLATKINREPKNAELGVSNGQVVVFKKESYGRELDKNTLLSEINLRLNSSSEKNIELPIQSLEPEVRSNNISTLGIKERISVGESNFAGSPKNRIHNLTLGASKFNGAIIRPNEVASFAKIVGSVEASDGYLPELVIKGTKTIQEYGGGMCQVSTTFYRATLNAGLPINERHSHAYLVGYYKDGPDATVYVPSTDLKFKNDTGHYILVQTKVDPTKKKLTFEFWGSSDGRKVTISPPSYTDIIPAPIEPYYVDDPTYPTGYLVEEEHAHEGATGIIIRTITYPDGKIKTEEIKSVYKPWPAKIRRGTGPADLPIPTS